MKYDKNKLKAVVDAYHSIKKGCSIERQGYVRYGVYKSLEEDARSESVLEHSTGVWALLRAMQTHFPDLVFSYWRDWEDAKDLAILHDIGETQTGDVCDDGTREESVDILERAFVQKACELTFGKSTAERLFKKFVEFQEKSTNFGRVLYMADKVEAVLQGLQYEKAGHGGKIDYISASAFELEGARETESEELADIWLYSFAKNANKYDYFELFLEIVIMAGQMVRKTEEPFPWLEKVI